MSRYFAAPGSPFNDKDAATIGPILTRLAQSGASRPADIVEFARAKKTPLRRYLDMERPVQEAAERWYRHRARIIASSIMVEVATAEGKQRVRAFHSVVVNVAPREGDERPPPTRRYVTIQQVSESPPMAEQVLADALERLEEWTSRYRLYREVFAEIRPEVEDVFAAADRLIA